MWAHVTDFRKDIPNMDAPGGNAGAKRGQTATTYWVDVVEQNTWQNNRTNQYYLTAKYGGYTIAPTAWNANGDAQIPDAAAFANNTTAGRASWTSQATATPGG